ncbi:MAG: response regulator transcription factor [Planctomycetota bacterium]|jgi:DNA-binding response OmpR family regulator
MAYVMIVDDDKDFATAASRVIRSAGHDVVIETDTEHATKSMEEKRPDLAILDVMFPEDSTSGFTMARAMRLANEKLKNVPIMMLTAVNARFPLGFSEEDIDDNWLPVDDFVEKPVDLDVLVQRVNGLLARSARDRNGTEG